MQADEYARGLLLRGVLFASQDPHHLVVVVNQYRYEGIAYRSHKFVEVRLLHRVLGRTRK